MNTMTDSEKRVFMEEMVRAVDGAVERKVGEKMNNFDTKITELTDNFNTHKEMLEPYIQAMSGLNILSKFFLLLGAVAAAYIAIKSALAGHSV